MKEIIANLTSNISIFDVIDVLAVAFIVYNILGFIKDTRAQQLIKGILAIIAVFVVSSLLELNTLNWIMRTIVTMGAIALIILFQPELRRGLEYMGRGAFTSSRWVGDKDKAKGIIDAIVDAVSDFSATRTGALLILEGDIALGEIVETGTKLDAEITKELIENIFYKGSPLHDGAAIVRGDKLLAAGCVLPLSSSMDLGKDLGTRHRAALGISESSDAVAIVVSEETGVISVAQGNKLNRFLDEKGLEKFLLNLYLTEGMEDRGIISTFRRLTGGGSKDAK